MSRSVRQDYPPKGATMPRYTQALNEILENVSAPNPRVPMIDPGVMTPVLPAAVTSGALTYAAAPRCGFHCEFHFGHLGAHQCSKDDCAVNPALPKTDTVDVEVIIHTAGIALPVVRYIGLELSTVLEATGHLNDNAERVEA